LGPQQDIPTAGVMVQDPAFGFPFVVVAFVLKIAAPLTTADVSLLTKPLIVAVNVGAAAPYASAAESRNDAKRRTIFRYDDGT